MKRLRPFFLLLLVLFSLQQVSAQQKQFKALLVTRTRGFQHESVNAGVLAIQQLGMKNFFDVVLLESPTGFTDKNLEQIQVIIFLNTTLDIFDSTEQKVMERFIKSGKGFVGIHAAADTEYDWEWYTQLVGRSFYIHPVIQTARLNVIDTTFPGLQGFTGNKLWTDEWYQYGPEKISGLKYLMTVDESTYNAKAERPNKKTDGMGKFHPVSWYHEFDGGRAFYTGLGHIPIIYSDPAFLNHLYAGIFWAATGKK